MTNINELEKLGQLYQKKLITKAEFEKQKAALLAAENTSENGAKSQGIYILLALFLGGFGVHNFYAGYYKRAVAQLILTILAPFTLGITALVNFVWIFINIFMIQKDAKGVPFKPCLVAKIIAAILLGLCLLGFVLIMIIGGIAGYSMAMTRYQANEILNYTAHVSTLGMSQNLDQGYCRDVVEEPEILADKECFFMARPDGAGYIFQLDDLEEDVEDALEPLVEESMKQQGKFLFTF